jgi:hypothetical protein
MNPWLCAQVDPAASRSLAPATAPAGEGLSTSLAHTWPWPAWITLLFLICAVALVVMVYLREQGTASRKWRWSLAAARVGLVLLVVFMLYGWTRQLHRLDLPDLVVAIDNSGSMSVVDQSAGDRPLSPGSSSVRTTGLDQASRFNLARSLLLHSQRGWLARLQRDYRVKLYSLGETARSYHGSPAQLEDALQKMQPTGIASRLGLGLREILDAQRGRPTAAVVLLTDGVTTEGPTLSDVADVARRKAVPLYLVGLGSDHPPLDLRLSDLLVDDAVFVDEMVNFDAQLHGNGLIGRSVTVRLKRPDRADVLAEQKVVVPADDASLSVRLSYRPGEEGDFDHVLEVAPVAGELNVENNLLTQRVHVRNATLRVLLVQAAPSYEYRFLKELLSRAVRVGKEGTSKAVDLTAVLQEGDLEHSRQDPTSQTVFPVRREELFAYDVLIFGDVNPAFLSNSVMEHISEFVLERGGGVVFIAGPQFSPIAYRDTPLARLFPVDLATASLPAGEQPLTEAFAVRPTALGLATPHLQLGDTSAESERIWSRLPGVFWFAATPDVRPAARVLAVHPERTGPQGEPLPLILLQFAGAGKVILQNTDESFRWGRFPGDPQYYARYWMQTLRYLSRSLLRSPDQTTEITTDRQRYRRGEPVQLRVQYFDEQRAPVEDDGAVVIVQQVGGRQRQIVLQRDSIRRGVFQGTVSDLPDGQYRVWLAAAAGQTAAENFVITAPPGEQATIAMDSQDLRRAAQKSQGRFATLQDANRALAQLPRGRRVIIESLPPEPLWNAPLVASIFVVLVSLEWILRKRIGML